MEKEKMDLLEVKMDRVAELMKATGVNVERMLATYALMNIKCDSCPLCPLDGGCLTNGLNCEEKWYKYLMGVDVCQKKN